MHEVIIYTPGQENIQATPLIDTSRGNCPDLIVRFLADNFGKLMPVSQVYAQLGYATPYDHDLDASVLHTFMGAARLRIASVPDVRIYALTDIAYIMCPPLPENQEIDLFPIPEAVQVKIASHPELQELATVFQKGRIVRKIIKPTLTSVEQRLLTQIIKSYPANTNLPEYFYDESDRKCKTSNFIVSIRSKIVPTYWDINFKSTKRSLISSSDAFYNIKLKKIPERRQTETSQSYVKIFQAIFEANQNKVLSFEKFYEYHGITTPTQLEYERVCRQISTVRKELKKQNLELYHVHSLGYVCCLKISEEQIPRFLPVPADIEALPVKYPFMASLVDSLHVGRLVKGILRPYFLKDERELLYAVMRGYPEKQRIMYSDHLHSELFTGHATYKNIFTIHLQNVGCKLFVHRKDPDGSMTVFLKSL